MANSAIPSDLVAIHDYILATPVEESSMVGGLYTVNTKEDGFKLRRAKVVSCGTGTFVEGAFVPMPCKVGDEIFVLANRKIVATVQGGGEVWLLWQKDLVAVTVSE